MFDSAAADCLMKELISRVRDHERNRDEGKRIPIELARTLYGEIGVAIEKYFEHLTYMEHFGVALCQFNLRPSDSANEYVADCCVLQADVNGKATADFQSAYDRAAIAILMSLCYAFQSYLNESNGLDLQDENGERGWLLSS